MVTVMLPVKVQVVAAKTAEMRVVHPEVAVPTSFGEVSSFAYRNGIPAFEEKHE
jgi:hypothetical protein